MTINKLPYFLLIISFCIIDHFQYVEGLYCYVTRPNGPMEKAVSCKDIFVVPTKTQMDESVGRDAMKHKRGQMACAKVGVFQKGCVFVAADRKMGCNEMMEDAQVDQVLQAVAMNSMSTGAGPTNTRILPLKECLCNTDRCNSAQRLGRPLLSHIFQALVICYYLIG